MHRTLAGAVALVALAGCVSRDLDLPVGYLDNAGGPPGSGGVCAYYYGANRPGFDGFKVTLRRRACFPSRRACEAWLYAAQTKFPVTFLSKRCR